MNNPHVHQFRSFMETRLPELLAGRETLRVVVSTYNNINGISEGALDTGHKDLSVFVQAGGFMPMADPLLILAAIALGPDAADAVLKSNNEDAESALAGVQSRTKELAWSGVPTLAFVYYGLSAGDRPIDVALQLRKDLSATVVLIACDCDADQKVGRVRSLLESREIDGLVFGEACGCRDDLRKVVKRIIALWPDRARDAA